MSGAHGRIICKSAAIQQRQADSGIPLRALRPSREAPTRRRWSLASRCAVRRIIGSGVWLRR